MKKKKYILYLFVFIITHHFGFVIIPAFVDWSDCLWNMGLWTEEKRGFYLATVIFCPLLSGIICFGGD